uniref:Uncharacterized protein n=1 Tax=Tanacetum cinerariifolium TaxID=118510 RepID=A0A699QDJ3_TANCI|nr:hypothetical protein [Tanacetum cinerariifolium]
MAVLGPDEIVGLSQQVQTLQTALHGTELQNQQLRTRVAEMESHVGMLMSYMLWMEEHLSVLEKRLPGPPLGPHPIRIYVDSCVINLESRLDYDGDDEEPDEEPKEEPEQQTSVCSTP